MNERVAECDGSNPHDFNRKKARKFGSKFHDFPICLISTIDSQIQQREIFQKLINELEDWLIIAFRFLSRSKFFPVFVTFSSLEYLYLLLRDQTFEAQPKKWIPQNIFVDLLNIV